MMPTLDSAREELERASHLLERKLSDFIEVEFRELGDLKNIEVVNSINRMAFSVFIDSTVLKNIQFGTIFVYALKEISNHLRYIARQAYFYRFTILRKVWKDKLSRCRIQFAEAPYVPGTKVWILFDVCFLNEKVFGSNSPITLSPWNLISVKYPSINDHSSIFGIKFLCNYVLRTCMKGSRIWAE